MPVSRDVHDRVEGSDRVERVSWEAELFEIAVDESGPRHLGASEPELLLGQIHADELERPGEPGDLGAVPATEVEHTGVRGQPSRELVEELLARIAFDSLPPTRRTACRARRTRPERFACARPLSQAPPDVDHRRTGPVAELEVDGLHRLVAVLGPRRQLAVAVRGRPADQGLLRRGRDPATTVRTPNRCQAVLRQPVDALHQRGGADYSSVLEREEGDRAAPPLLKPLLV